MSVERTTHNPDHSETLTPNLETARQEQLEKLRQSIEATPEKSAEHRAEAAREIINRPEAKAAPLDSEAQKEPAKPFFPVALTPQLNYTQTLASLQRRLSPVSRAFSKVIHAPVIEATSETVGKTIARPSVISGATITAAIVGSIFYATARYYGYPLSGSEMLFALIIGGTIGIILESCSRFLFRRR